MAARLSRAEAACGAPRLDQKQLTLSRVDRVQLGANRGAPRLDQKQLTLVVVSLTFRLLISGAPRLDQKQLTLRDVRQQRREAGAAPPGSIRSN